MKESSKGLLAYSRGSVQLEQYDPSKLAAVDFLVFNSNTDHRSVICADGIETAAFKKLSTSTHSTRYHLGLFLISCYQNFHR
jgi:hypothetical protein